LALGKTDTIGETDTSSKLQAEGKTATSSKQQARKAALGSRSLALGKTDTIGETSRLPTLASLITRAG
jgi:hypothetical protein